MGKKSRLKREKHDAHSAIPTVAAQATWRDQPRPQDTRFLEEIAALRAYFVQFGAIEVILGLSVSDLWPPNRSSQVKHSLAILVALSMLPSEYQARQSIVTYKEFTEFLDGLNRLLPRFPMLEDFVPEGDWGDVRVAGASGFERIFYGGSVERIPDFIEAFRILRSDHHSAIDDMNLGVALQAHIIGVVDAGLVGREDRVASGHMEAPTADFWFHCREALMSTYVAIQPLINGTSVALVVEQGTLKAPHSSGSFSDAIMTGTVLPLLFVKVVDTYLPIAPRSASSVVVDLWNERIGSCSIGELPAFGGRLGTFLSHRLRQDDVIVGPAKLMGTSHRFDRHLAAVIRSGEKLYFLLPIDPDDLPRLGQIERWLNRLVDKSARWALSFADTKQIVELRNGKGDFARSDSIQLLAVIARVSTQPIFLEMPASHARVIGLPDFISLFDSINGSRELEDFWVYWDSMESRTGGMIGLIDHFAAFRDSHGVLIEGAESPDWISLDPHWNSSWRFKELKSFWAAAPYSFPDEQSTWVVDKKEDGLTCMKAKGPFALAWSGSAGTCTVQAVMEVNSDPDYKNGPLLELFVHCVADAITQRSTLLARLDLFRRTSIVIYCSGPMKYQAA